MIFIMYHVKRRADKKRRYMFHFKIVISVSLVGGSEKAEAKAVFVCVFEFVFPIQNVMSGSMVDGSEEEWAKTVFVCVFVFECVFPI